MTRKTEQTAFHAFKDKLESKKSPVEETRLPIAPDDINSSRISKEDVLKQEEEIDNRVRTVSNLIDDHQRICKDVKKLVMDIGSILANVASLERNLRSGDVKDAKLARKLNVERLVNDLRVAHRTIRQSHRRSVVAGTIRRDTILGDIRSGK